MSRVSKVFFVFIFLGVVPAFATRALGQQEFASQPEFALVQQFDKRYVAINESTRLQLVTQVAVTIDQLDQHLGQLDPFQRATWRHSLCLNELEQLLAEDSIDHQAYRRIAHCFYGITRGLEQTSMVELRQTLMNYADFLRIYGEHNGRAQFDQCLFHLNNALRDPQRADTLWVARNVQWLIGARQDVELIRSVQSHFEHPSIVVDVNPDLFEPYLKDFRKEISESKFTTNRIVGVPVSGVSHIQLTAWPELADRNHRATVLLKVDGKIQSPSNQSRPDPQRAPLIGNVAVELNSEGQTTVTGSKEIYWDGMNLVADPAIVQCHTEATLNNVDISRNYRRRPQSRVARNVDDRIRQKARREVEKNTPLAQKQSATIAEREIGQQLDAEVQGLLDKANGEIDKYFRAPLVRLGFFPIGSSHSSSDLIRIGMRGASDGGIGAPGPPPKRELDGDVVVTLHESVCTTLGASFLRGRELRDIDLNHVQRELRGFVPMELRISGNEPWSVHLSDQFPLALRFRDNQLTVVLYIDSFQVDGQVVDYPLTVAATYDIVPGINMPKFNRVGNVTLQWLDGQPQTLKSGESSESFLNRKFNAFFAKFIHMDGLSAPVGNEWGATAHMTIVSSDLSHGWWRVVFKTQDFNWLD